MIQKIQIQAVKASWKNIKGYAAIFQGKKQKIIVCSFAGQRKIKVLHCWEKSKCSLLGKATHLRNTESCVKQRITDWPPGELLQGRDAGLPGCSSENDWHFGWNGSSKMGRGLARWGPKAVGWGTSIKIVNSCWPALLSPRLTGKSGRVSISHSVRHFLQKNPPIF